MYHNNEVSNIRFPEISYPITSVIIITYFHRFKKCHDITYTMHVH